MSSSLRRGALAATALVLSIAPLTACAAGNDAQTLGVRPDNASITVGDIKIQNVNVITSEDGAGPAAVTGRIFNGGSQDQRLEAVTVPGSGERVKLTAADDGNLIVPAGGWLALGGKGNAAAVISDAEEAGIKNGDAQPVVFDLSSTGEVKLDAIVVPATGSWEKFGPSAAPSPSKSPGQDEERDEEQNQGADEEQGEPEQSEQPGEDEQLQE